MTETFSGYQLGHFEEVPEDGVRISPWHVVPTNEHFAALCQEMLCNPFTMLDILF